MVKKRYFYYMLVSLSLLCVIAGCHKQSSQEELELKIEEGERNNQSANVDTLTENFRELEEEYDARLGIYVIDTANNQTIQYREDDRFAYTSTFKALAAAVLLQQNSLSALDEVRTYTQEDIVTYSPITEQYVNDGMSLKDIAIAAVQYSDNTAGNLLFEELGGPKGFEEALRDSGDTTTMPSRIETELNEAVPGDSRDTSTPKALATTLEVFGLSEYLSADKRELFIEWLKGNTTGDSLIRAGVPENWEVGDKTGAGGYGTRNDIAIVWPPDREPIVMAILSSRSEEDADYDDELIAKASELIAQSLYNE
ncbi:class A beta-lactamase [Alkalicoccobacillus gibsonii]|uniref:class A beta-lactamase n=1 Tax=Alkalicoccobacillus gibsonii TaxID=79881 RepID=UPI003F7B8B4C